MVRSFVRIRCLPCEWRWSELLGVRAVGLLHAFNSLTRRNCTSSSTDLTDTWPTQARGPGCSGRAGSNVGNW